MNDLVGGEGRWGSDGRVNAMVVVMIRGVGSAICLRYKLNLSLWALLIPDLRCTASILQ